jgi:hypothetical protein
MSIRSEEILLKEVVSGTTLIFFSTHLNPALDFGSNPPFSVSDLIPTYIEFNNLGLPVSMTAFDGQNLWKLNNDNAYETLTSSTQNYTTGYSFVQEYNRVLAPNKVASTETSFFQFLNNALNSTQSPQILGDRYDKMFVKTSEVNDFYVNIKLNRTFGTLDTVNIYNNLINSIPSQEANTGVVFGRLLALQNIKDTEGNNIRIPLRNVPIGIFNPSDDYPSSASVTDNGDRIFLNLRESAQQSEYFNIESFDYDKNKLLRSASQFTNIPDQYRYVTKTNDEGEFVIYDAPVGTQIVVFEVDLLKQGLTRDEIALNFFPFPPDEDAIIDQIPNFVFKQFPIDVIPAWGTVQTGYTELDITVNMDLRKWTTYIFPPVSVGAQRLESAVAQNSANSVKVEIRNMAKEGFPKSEIKLTEIQNDLDRVFGQQYNWHIEFAQIKDKAEFYKFGCPVVKLPANLYDPNGYRTDINGNPTTHKGVWLSAYQLKIYSNTNIDRRTGSIYAWNGSNFYTKSHFDLNFSPSVPDTAPSPDPGLGVGFFPYEQPWTTEYPEKYSIPKKPTNERYRYAGDRTPTSNLTTYYLDEPAYTDGDLVGYEVVTPSSTTAGGFGSQAAFGEWITNRISQVATKNFMYKYEKGVAWNEEYANGFQPSNPGYPRFTGITEVVGGEKYQRFESGYGYFLRPSGWPRLIRTEWGSDTYFNPDITYNNGLNGDPENPGPGLTPAGANYGSIYAFDGHVNDVYNLNNIDLALVMDNNSRIKRGTLEAYRIINSNPENLNLPGQFLIPTYIRLADGGSPSRCYSFALTNTGEAPVYIPFAFRAQVNHSTGGTVSGGYIYLKPGQYVSVPNPLDSPSSPSPQDVLGWCLHTLPGNSNFNFSTNRYDVAKYEIRIAYNGDVNGSYAKYINIEKPALTSPQTWYIKTQHIGGSSGRISYGMNTDYGGNNDAEIWSAFIENNSSQYDL